MEPKVIKRDMEAEQKRFVALRQMIGLAVTIQEKGGVVIVGQFADFTDGYLRIEGATITGRTKKVSPPYVLVHQSSVSHIHPAVEAAPKAASV